MTTLMLNYKKKCFINSKSNFHSCDSSSHWLLGGDFFYCLKIVTWCCVLQSSPQVLGDGAVSERNCLTKVFGKSLSKSGNTVWSVFSRELVKSVLRGHPKRNKTSVYTKFKLRGWNRIILPLSLLFLSLDLI